jgi:hypothetical protein
VPWTRFTNPGDDERLTRVRSDALERVTDGGARFEFGGVAFVA